MRMSKLRLAEYHYRKAASIHPQNAVLLGCVGMVSHAWRVHSSRFHSRFADDDCSVRDRVLWLLLRVVVVRRRARLCNTAVPA